MGVQEKCGGEGKYLQSGWAPDEAEVENTEVSATDCWRAPYVDDSVPFSLFILCVSKTWSNFSVGEKTTICCVTIPRRRIASLCIRRVNIAVHTRTLQGLYLSTILTCKWVGLQQSTRPPTGTLASRQRNRKKKRETIPKSLNNVSENLGKVEESLPPCGRREVSEEVRYRSRSRCWSLMTSIGKSTRIFCLMIFSQCHFTVWGT